VGRRGSRAETWREGGGERAKGVEERKGRKERNKQTGKGAEARESCEKREVRILVSSSSEIFEKNKL